MPSYVEIEMQRQAEERRRREQQEAERKRQLEAAREAEAERQRQAEAARKAAELAEAQRQAAIREALTRKREVKQEVKPAGLPQIVTQTAATVPQIQTVSQRPAAAAKQPRTEYKPAQVRQDMVIRRSIPNISGIQNRVGESGEIEYYLNGKRVTKQELETHINQLKKAGIDPSGRIRPEDENDTESSQESKDTDILMVGKTSNPDKFVVRVKADNPAGYVEKTMTRQQIINAGGEVPVSGSHWWYNPSTIGERMVQTQGLTETDIIKAYKALGLTAPDFANAPRDVIGINKNGDGLAGYIDPVTEEPSYNHPSQFGNIGVAAGYAETILDPAAKADYLKAFRAYWGINPGDVVIALPGEKERFAGSLGFKSVKDKNFLSMLERFKENPDSPEFTLIEAGGTITLEQKQQLAAVAGVSYNAAADYRRALVSVGDPRNNEYVTRVEYERILKETPGLAETLKRKGLAAYNADAAGMSERQEAPYKVWFKKNIESDKYLNSVYLEKGEKAAVDAYNKRQEELDAIFDRWAIKNIKSDKYLNSVLLEKGEKAALEAYQNRKKQLQALQVRLDKYNAENTPTEEQLKALELLAPYRTNSGKYRLYDALNESYMDMWRLKGEWKNDGTNEYYQTNDGLIKHYELQRAVELLFSSKDVERFKSWYPHWFEKRPRVSEGDISLNAWQEAQAALPAGLVAAAGYSKQTPIPYDDLAALIVLTVFGAGAAVGNAIKEWRESNKDKPISEATIAVIDNANNVELLDPKLFFPPGGITLGPDMRNIILTKEELIPPRINTADNTPYPAERAPIAIEELIPANIKSVLLLPTPAYRPRAEEQIMQARMSDLGKAEKGLVRNLPRVKEIEIVNLPEVINMPRVVWPSTRGRKTDQEITAAQTKLNGILRQYRLNRHIGKSNIAITRQMQEILKADEIYRGAVSANRIARSAKWETAHQEYLRKLALWVNAWHSYVNSVDPSPVKGEVTPEIKSLIAEALLIDKDAKSKKKRKGKIVIESDTDIQAAIQQSLSTLPKEATGTKTALKDATKTTTGTKTKTRPQTKTKAKEQTKTETKTQTKTKTDTKPAENVKTTTGTTTATTDTTKTTTRTGTNTAINTSTTIRTLKGFDIPGRPQSKDDDNKKQAYLKTVKGLVARQRGALKGLDGTKRPVWLISYHPYGDKDKLVMFEQPYGTKAVNGKGSMAESIFARGKLPKQPIIEDKEVGAFTDVISTKGKKAHVESFRDKPVKPRMPKPKKFRMPKMIDQGDGIVYNPRTGKGHLKID
jgi:hypothetical protein